MSEPTKAVFLSYAREDTDAARRIADALRARSASKCGLIRASCAAATNGT